MYKLFTDKTELFECDIKVEGTSLSKSKARLVVETSDYSLMFNGSIDSNGKCKVPIRKLKGLIDESSSGNIRLEVIAEDTFFTPWESNFEIQKSKKVTVEVKTQHNKPIIKESKIKVSNVKNTISKKETNHVVNILKLLVRENINLDNLKLKKDRVNKIIAVYNRYQPLPEDNKSKIIDGILEGLGNK
tara:strand:+ start:2211 stop:2774 length:564 start_codon:yes stop_codon:yes gene_type:complete